MYTLEVFFFFPLLLSALSVFIVAIGWGPGIIELAALFSWVREIEHFPL